MLLFIAAYILSYVGDLCSINLQIVVLRFPISLNEASRLLLWHIFSMALVSAIYHALRTIFNSSGEASFCSLMCFPVLLITECIACL